VKQDTPAHIGFILDGNRRWATARNLTTLEGHRQGYANLKAIAQHAFEKGVSYVSAFIFSTENWNRTKEEVDYLMQLGLRLAVKDATELTKQNIKIVVFGIEDKVPIKVIRALRKVESNSAHNDGGVLILCFNYGGHQEISDAVRQIVAKGTKETEVTPELIAKHLYHPDVPPVDLVIRTSGEQRISNFMLWRVAYAEFYFAQKHWPEFDTMELDTALAEYTKRNRRFGGN